MVAAVVVVVDEGSDLAVGRSMMISCSTTAPLTSSTANSD